LANAEGGTVFFDEIGELPMSTQVKLLRLLQEREYEPLGSTKPVKVDIRVVAATNKDLKQLVAQAKFRDDLYFRLAVVKFELPPLTRRREDIPYLVDHFIKKFDARTGKRIMSVSPEVMEILMRHDFPAISASSKISSNTALSCAEEALFKRNIFRTNWFRRPLRWLPGYTAP